MLPGPDQIIACPACHALARQFTLMSGNTFGATLWTDGFLDAPMLPRGPALVRCSSCRVFYWVGHADVVGEIKPFTDEEVDPAWEAAEHVSTPTPEEYREALSLGAASDPDSTRYILVQIWWGLNDKFRGEEADTPWEPDGAFVENLQALDGLLDENIPDDRMMRAEIARQLGRFEEAEKLLENLPQDFEWAARQMRKLVENRDRRVRTLTSPDEEDTPPEEET